MARTPTRTLGATSAPRLRPSDDRRRHASARWRAARCAGGGRQAARFPAPGLPSGGQRGVRTDPADEAAGRSMTRVVAVLALAVIAACALAPAPGHAQSAAEQRARRADGQAQALEAQEQLLAFRRCVQHARIRREAERRGLSPAELCTALASLAQQQR